MVTHAPAVFFQQDAAVGTVAAAVFGSCFPTTIYIGHPSRKAMGARFSYSILNAGFITAPWAAGYALMAAIFDLSRWLTIREGEPDELE